jgi:hypothetical protein
MPVAGTSALVGTVTLVALTLVILTAVSPATARSATPTAGSDGSRSDISFLHPQALASTTTAPAPVTVTTPVSPTTEAPQAAAPPTTRPVVHPAPHPTKPPPPPTTPPVIPVASHPILPPANPTANIAESPNFASTCRQDGTESAPCIAATAQAIAAAGAEEGLGAMVLPSNYASLPAGEQLFVLTDIERVDRGLPPVVGMVAQFNTDAQNAAAANTDPTPVSPPPGSTVMSWASNWAEAAGPMGSDYNWMYDDGPGSGDIDCNASDPGSCWGHRDNILGFNASQIATSHGVLVMGAAEANVASDSPWTSDAMLFALVTGSPTYTYTWADAEAAGAR